MASSHVFDLLGRAARELTDALDGTACAISRVLGDVLIQVAEHVESGATLQLGMGYLISDYPETKVALETREPRALSLADEQVDEAEAALLQEFGYDALLMLPLVVRDEVWGLVEIYRASGRQFSAADAERAQAEVRRLGDELAEPRG